MDGDRRPGSPVELKDRFGAWLMLMKPTRSVCLRTTGPDAPKAEGVASRIEIQFGTLGGLGPGGLCLRLPRPDRPPRQPVAQPHFLHRARARRRSMPHVRPSKWSEVPKARGDAQSSGNGSPTHLPRSEPGWIEPHYSHPGRGRERAAVSRSGSSREGCLVPAIRYPTVSWGGHDSVSA